MIIFICVHCHIVLKQSALNDIIIIPPYTCRQTNSVESNLEYSVVSAEIGLLRKVKIGAERYFLSLELPITNFLRC